MAEFSVLLPVYHRDSPDHLAACLYSLGAQTRPAGEVLIIKDGPLGEALESVLDSYSTTLPIGTIQLPESRGLGPALRVGVENCKFEIIARMDADDICAVDRFEMQIGFLEAHPEIDALSGTIREFDSAPAVWVTERRLPSEHLSILAFAKRRNPMNHMAVVMRRSAVMAAGGYESRPGFEDYDLWVRMLMCGAKFHNLDAICVFARCGNGMHRRRGGWNYAWSEASLFWHFRSLGFLTTGEAMRDIAMRAPIRLVPTGIRSLLYRLLVRKPAIPDAEQPQRAAR